MSGREIREYSRRMDSASAQLKPLVRSVVVKAAMDTVRDSKMLAPVDTGNLRNSIGSDITEAAGSIEAEVGPTADYGYYVEYGTSRNQNPQPFMGPAYDKNQPKLEQALGQIPEDVL